MKIFEFDQTVDYGLLEPRRRSELDTRSAWGRQPAREPSRLPASFEREVAAPSVHRGKSLKMHVLDLGTLRLDKNFVVSHTTVATHKNPNPPSQLIDIPVAAFYIEHPDGNILYDTGCHPDWAGPNGRWPDNLQEAFPHSGGDECMLPARLDALGVGPDQIRHVVLSHLHCDHAGCVEYFRKSNIVIHEDEFSGAFRQYALNDHSTPYALKDLGAMISAELQWREIGRDEPDQKMSEGVRLLNFGPGHARGMLGLQISLRSQAGVFLVSDACYTAENYGPPPKLPGIGYDTLGIARTVQRIKALARDSDCDVWFGHDAAQFAGLRKSTEGYYE